MAMATGAIFACLLGQTVSAENVPLWKRLLERRLEAMRAGEVSAPLLNRRQIASLQYVHYGSPTGWFGLRKAEGPRAVSLPDEEETKRFETLAQRTDSEVLEYLDEFYGSRNDLKALAARDSDGDNVPDYTVSDYFGKFMEGDIDVDGDGIRNTLDTFPYDPTQGGEDTDGDGIPDAAGSFTDANRNGIPDPVDFALDDVPEELAAIQRRLFSDNKIILLTRDAEIDLILARAIDDSVRRVFRTFFEHTSIMPTLRTIAVEKTALLGPLTKAFAEDHTSAQTFSQTQTLIIYDEGRAVKDAIGLLGLVVHEMGHSYHMALDFDASDLSAENARTDFPAPNFSALIKPFGWVQTGYYDGQFEGDLTVMPRFSYVGKNEPLYKFGGRTPEEWDEWVRQRYEALGEDPEYLKDPTFANLHIVSDYSLSSPYEWYSDNLIAYVISVLEKHALESLTTRDQQRALTRIEDALQAIWPGFYHRNIAPEIMQYFRQTFPITPADREGLVQRYIEPIIGGIR